MVISFLQILEESVKKLLPSDVRREAVKLPAIAVWAMLGTVVVKGIIWIGCARVKTTLVQALAQGTPIILIPSNRYGSFTCQGSLLISHTLTS